ncbi:hypothetical protein INT48_009360 [Thamnidium elegans]|uniref:Uncharacterized protein n=1 Tax=Thamnidium elegans TaxID=101142 RepID=A0A8H7VYP6_9FUNG|nr:hypothetical protein INT48_009360 [Thamnidium elegans]
MPQSNQDGLKQKASRLLEKLQLLPFRKMKTVLEEKRCPTSCIMGYYGKNVDNNTNYEISNVNYYLTASCTNSSCLDTTAARLWNRDLAAVLNFKKILFGLRSGPRPPHFTHNAKQ